MECILAVSFVIAMPPGFRQRPLVSQNGKGGVVIARLSLLGVIGLCGCGGSDHPEVGHVTGVVTVDGKPLNNAIVNFTPQTAGRASTGLTDEEGRYELLYTADVSGAVIGAHNVTLELIQEDDAESDAEEGSDGAATGLPPQATDGSIVKEVAAGNNTLDIEL